MPTYEQALAALGSARLPGGSLFYLLNTSSPVDVTFYGPKGKPLEVANQVEAGLKVEPDEPFLSVKIESALAQTIKAYITRGNISYDRLVGTIDLSPASLAELETISLSKASGLITVADVNVNAATGIVLAVNLNRKAAFISNLLANPNAIRVGDVNTGAARGPEVAIGATGIVSSTAAIYVYSAGNSNIGIMYTED